MNNKAWLNILVAAVMLSLACSLFSRQIGAPTAAPTNASNPASATQRQLGVFDAVFNAVRDQYVRADYGGTDWEAICAQYRGPVAGRGNHDTPSPTLRD